MKKKRIDLKKKLLLQKETLAALQDGQHIYGGAPVTENMRCLTRAQTCGESCNTFQPGSPYCIMC